MHGRAPKSWQLSELPYELEKKLGADPSAFLDPNSFRNAMLRAERCVCRIEIPELQARGSGFLVGPDLVLTNSHVLPDRPDGRPPFKANPQEVRARFGFVERSRVAARTYALRPADWLVAHSPVDELDYCLLRLAEPAGNDRIGHAPDAPIRGWITVSSDDLTHPQSLFILQHPLGEPLKVAPGHLTKAAGDWIDYHVSTDNGSSGSPVFDCLWRCVALHSRAGTTTNRGVHLKAILRALDASVREELLTPPPMTEADEKSFEQMAVARPTGLPVDLTWFSLPALQLLGRTLVRSLETGDVRSPPPAVEVKLGGGSRVQCLPNSDAATDRMSRDALKGELDLLDTRLEVRLELQDRHALQQGGMTGVQLKRNQSDIDASTKAICSRLEVLADEYYLTRHG